MSYPFSQQEVLAEASTYASGDTFQVLSVAARRLAPVSAKELIEGARAVEAARATVYKRTRAQELVVPDEGPTWRQVAAIIATVLVGAGVLGLPYALRRAGWSAILLIIGATVVASYTAKMLVWSFNELNERKLSPGGDVGKALVLVGLVIAAVGLLVMAGLPLGRLPGDLVIRRGGATIYLPIATCVVISLLVTLVGWLRR